MDARKLASKVKQIIDKHIRSKGYEIEAVLETPAPDTMNLDRLSILDDGQVQDNPIRETVKIVVTGHDLEENGTPLGDNPIETLDFISIEDGTEPEHRQIQEGRILEYNGKRYNIVLVAPATLAGQLIIKECQARAVQ